MSNQTSFGRRGASSAAEQRVFRTEVRQPIEVVVRRGGVRWGRWVLGAFGLCFVAGVIGNLTEGKPPLYTSKASVATERTANATSPSKCVATLAEYNSLGIGTSPAHAASVIGCAGVEMTRVFIGGHESLMLSWSGDGLFSNMNATFDNGRLIAKGQLGLK